MKRMTAEEKRWDALVAANIAEVVRAYGKERASRANIGWVADDDGICTKVYGDPCMLVTTEITAEGKYEHIHEAYQ